MGVVSTRRGASTTGEVGKRAGGVTGAESKDVGGVGKFHIRVDKKWAATWALSPRARTLPSTSS
eukprot:12072084-Prorocentrum_lima.AAC.1